MARVVISNGCNQKDVSRIARTISEVNSLLFQINFVHLFSFGKRKTLVNSKDKDIENYI